MSKVPCGGFKLDENFLGMNENDELSLTGGGSEGEAFKQLVTDDDGNVKWEDRLAYEYKEWKDFVLTEEGEINITGFTMPPVGDTVTVKVNGVESVETVKSGETEGQSYSYIGSTDFNGLQSGNNGWCVLYEPIYGIIATANPETVVSLLVTEQHKIDEKYIQQDKDFVRTLSYYIKSPTLFKPYYNESGEEIITYKCDSFKHLPHDNEVLIYDSSDVGIASAGLSYSTAFIIYGFISSNGVIRTLRQIYGTDETGIAELAAMYGYTLTTKPTT